ncbi:MAG: hypothetical protein NXY57DRAFT_1041250 [Lentinula lateritia]|nr:MAG: hypothetical protein NXY57DRAFT_1041250 [Lentinula lateritia]
MILDQDIEELITSYIIPDIAIIPTSPALHIAQRRLLKSTLLDPSLGDKAFYIHPQEPLQHDTPGQLKARKQVKAVPKINILPRTTRLLSDACEGGGLHCFNLLISSKKEREEFKRSRIQVAPPIPENSGSLSLEYGNPFELTILLLGTKISKSPKTRWDDLAFLAFSLVVVILRLLALAVQNCRSYQKPYQKGLFNVRKSPNKFAVLVQIFGMNRRVISVGQVSWRFFRFIILD